MPAIVITGSGDVRTAVQALRAGAGDFIEKPVGEAALLESNCHTNGPDVFDE